MNGQAGKGSRYRPVNVTTYGSEYDRIFGQTCTVCGGKGYHWDEDLRKQMVKTTCLICNGTGKVKA
jgi:DnaJ-class molecular chaperone